APRFDEQRHYDDKIASPSGLRPLLCKQTYHGMDDGFELLPGLGAGENQVAHGLAVQRAGGSDDIGAEMQAYGFDGRAAGRRQFVRDDIGVDDGRTPLGQQISHLAFARAYPARQPDLVHGTLPATKNANVTQTQPRKHRRRRRTKTGRRDRSPRAAGFSGATSPKAARRSRPAAGRSASPASPAKRPGPPTI